ncbi:hypothetical protein EQP59_02235 [Ornithobacterium rhinotracheale]|uniref:Uncharacterized protein n=1 Tax=Ornithobacterium rhinotracheale TaxID=28251 RepID=A0A3R5XTQ5_ORNRH|nr:hypothetical protein [Ornithobacterium rhinotracheale]QAR30259.1 hypothetical protein EQP59_02235 [Ornithobacterium rhinotracheale]
MKTLYIKSIDGCTDFRDITIQVKSSKYKRFLLYGGAKSAADNSAFYYASLNVKRDYGSDGEIIHQKVETAKKIIDLINRQKDDSIQSIDFFTHGSQYALYIVRDKKTKEYSSLKKDLKDDIESNNLYASRTVKKFQSWFAGEEEGVINDINFNKFTNSAKIEIHGCNTAASTLLVDNIVTNLSQYLHDAGKNKAVVIGHSQKANPNLPTTKRKQGETDKEWNKRKNQEQDYRHGERKVYHNGKVILVTKKQGRITAKEINDVL